MKKHVNAVLVLDDGAVFRGKSLGKYKDAVCGEVCFTTGMTGYQHTITDPSFAKQIIVFTFPHIGNVDINVLDNERNKVLASGIIIREPVVSCEHISAQTGFEQWMINNDLAGIYGIDTRTLTIHLRKSGVQNGIIHHFHEENEPDFKKLKLQLKEYGASDKIGLVKYACTSSKNYRQNSCGKLRIAVVDFGAKEGIIRCINSLGHQAIIISGEEGFADKVLNIRPDGILLSNGPGDPEDIASYSSNEILKLIDSGIIIFGICLGHQLIALSVGARSMKMNNGHRGSNHPVCELATGRIEITCQNHGFTIDPKSLPTNITVTHISLFDGTLEGIESSDKKVFSVQYHPESSPGPQDSLYLFERFIERILANKALLTQ